MIALSRQFGMLYVEDKKWGLGRGFMNAGGDMNRPMQTLAHGFARSLSLLYANTSMFFRNVRAKNWVQYSRPENVQP